MTALLLAQIVNGVSLGSIYVVLVTGFNLMLLIARVIHISYPHTVVLSVYVGWIVLQAIPGASLLAAFAAIVASIVFSMVMAPVFIRLSSSEKTIDLNTTMVVSLAFGLAITELMAQRLNRGFPIAFPSWFADGYAVVADGLVFLTMNQLIAITGAIFVVLCLAALLRFSRWGRSSRAIAENPRNAQLAGIPIIKTNALSFLIAGLIGGIAAIVIALLLASASASLADDVAIKALAVAIVAGLGNLTGGIVVALVLGLLEAFGQGFLGGSWSNAIALCALIGFLLLRPRGVFGARV